MERLTPRQREIVELACVEGLSNAELARRLYITTTPCGIIGSDSSNASISTRCNRSARSMGGKTSGAAGRGIVSSDPPESVRRGTSDVGDGYESERTTGCDA
jgi:hypothetical protein